MNKVLMEARYMNNKKPCVCRYSGEQINYIVTTIANIITSYGFTVEELSLLSLLFNMIGDAIAVTAATRDLCCNSGDEQLEVFQ